MKLKLLIQLHIISCVCCYPQNILFQELFDNADVANRDWYDNTRMVISTSEHIPGSAGSAEYHWLKGSTAPTTGGAMRKLFTPTDSVYIDFWIKYSPGYTGSDQPYHPHEFLVLTTIDDAWIGPAFTHLTAYIEHNEGIPLLAFQDGMNIDLSNLNNDLTNVTEDRAVCGCNGIPAEEQASNADCYPVGNNVYWNGKAWKADQVYFQNTPGAYYQNDWHHIAAFIKLNTISGAKGNPNGAITYWYDDQIIIKRTNLILRTAQHPDMQFNQFMIAPWIGDGSPVDQTFWIDNLTVSTGLITSTIFNHRATDERVTLFPNPFSESAVIELKNIPRTPHDNLCFNLYNMFGEKINTISHISGERLAMGKKELKNGTYFYQLKLNGSIIATGKMIIL